MNKKIFTIIIAIGLFSCEQKKRELLNFFPKTKHVNTELIELKEEILRDPCEILILDTIAMVRSNSGNYYVDVIGLKSRRVIKQLLFKGKGPDEYLFVSDMVKFENSIDIHDVLNKRIVSYNRDSLLKDFYKPKIVWQNNTDATYLKSKRGKDSLCISTGLLTNGMYVLTSKKEIRNYLSYPFDEKHINESNLIKGTAYQGRLMCHPEQLKFVFAYSGGAMIEICSYGNSGISKEKNLHFQLPEYVSYKNGTAKERESLRGFHSLAVTSNSIFTLYSGKKVGDCINHSIEGKYLLEFNWEGELICKYILDQGLRCIAIGNKEKELYGIAYTPEPAIVKINL
jgi:hypothetical protein